MNPNKKAIKPIYKFAMKDLMKTWRYSARKKYQLLQKGTKTVGDIELSAHKIARLLIRLPL